MQKSAQAPHRGSAYLQDALIAGPCGDRPVGDTSIMSCSSGKASIGTGSVKSHLWTSLDLAFTPSPHRFHILGTQGVAPGGNYLSVWSASPEERLCWCYSRDVFNGSCVRRQADVCSWHLGAHR